MASGSASSVPEGLGDAVVAERFEEDHRGLENPPKLARLTIRR